MRNNVENILTDVRFYNQEYQIKLLTLKMAEVINIKLLPTISIYYPANR